MIAIAIYIAVYAGLLVLLVRSAPLDTEIGHD